MVNKARYRKMYFHEGDIANDHRDFNEIPIKFNAEQT
jgi:hypothetical protein